MLDTVLIVEIFNFYAITNKGDVHHIIEGLSVSRTRSFTLNFIDGVGITKYSKRFPNEVFFIIQVKKHSMGITW